MVIGRRACRICARKTGGNSQSNRVVHGREPYQGACKLLCDVIRATNWD